LFSWPSTGTGDIVPIITAKTSAITIVPTVELTCLSRVFEVFIVTFHSWSAALLAREGCLS
jgi:hypothetical protein